MVCTARPLTPCSLTWRSVGHPVRMPSTAAPGCSRTRSTSQTSSQVGWVGLGCVDVWWCTPCICGYDTPSHLSDGAGWQSSAFNRKGLCLVLEHIPLIGRRCVCVLFDMCLCSFVLCGVWRVVVLMCFVWLVFICVVWRVLVLMCVCVFC